MQIVLRWNLKYIGRKKKKRREPGSKSETRREEESSEEDDFDYYHVFSVQLVNLDVDEKEDYFSRHDILVCRSEANKEIEVKHPTYVKE